MYSCMHWTGGICEAAYIFRNITVDSLWQTQDTACYLDNGVVVVQQDAELAYCTPYALRLPHTHLLLATPW
jgi:hypothetical protein